MKKATSLLSHFTARLGPEDLAHHETVQGLVQLLEVCARKQDVEIMQDSSRLE